MRSIFIAVVLALTVVPTKADVSEDLKFCATIKSRGERLACFDAAARIARTKLASERPNLSRTGGSGYREPAVSKQSWTGVFVGIGVGGGRTINKANGTLVSQPGGNPTVAIGGVTTSPVSSNASGNGATFSVRTGANWQFNDLLVAGLLGDLSLPSIRASQSTNVGPCDHPACTSSFSFQDSSEFRANWSATIAARGGFLVGENWIYGLGGLAIADFSADILTITNNVFSFQRRGFSAVGWTAGFGLERRLVDGWSAFAEYRYTDFPRVSQSYTSSSTCAVFGNCFAQTSLTGSLSFQTIQVGAARQFNF